METKYEQNIKMIYFATDLKTIMKKRLYKIMQHVIYLFNMDDCLAKKSQEEFLISKRNLAKKLRLGLAKPHPVLPPPRRRRAAWRTTAVTLSFIVSIHPLKCSCRTGALASIRAKR